MEYKEETFKVSSVKDFKTKCLYWADTSSVFNFFSGTPTTILYGSFHDVLFIGAHKSIPDSKGNSFESLKQFHSHGKCWICGFFSYDLKNEIEDLYSILPDVLNYPDIYFYQPQVIIFFKDNDIRILSLEESPSRIFNSISNWSPRFIANHCKLDFIIKPSRDAYLQKVNKIKELILDGEIYEMNLCIQFIQDEAEIDPIQLFLKSERISPSPFSVLQKYNDKYAVCASPERFMKKEGSKLISQPIKGTARRDLNSIMDNKIKEDLFYSSKERAENLMIVDLVRNDLARSSLSGSVKVEELFGIYSFTYVHQMISTITSTLRSDVHWTKAIQHAFPMGSMTGAPKIRSMELIEAFEETKRSLFSGAIGYVDPDGNFDFNVVIRSLFYNKDSGTLSFITGSAITIDSIGENEYEECLLKARAMINLLDKNLD